MPDPRPRSRLGTHIVENQPEPSRTLDLWDADGPLRDAVARAGAGAHVEGLRTFATEIGSAEALEDGRLANRHPPELVLFDRSGRRLDEVSFHPAYHAMMQRGAEAGYAALPWTAGAPGGHSAHAAMVYLLSQVEPGVCCPLTMTYAAVPALAHTPALAAEWTPRLTTARYDPASRPAAEKTAATMGMAMTEKQGGSDLRSNTTRAEADGEGWRLTGHKWFCSAPMSDAFLTLAQAPGGLTCFLVPRWTPDGERNAIRLMRLKDKLGNRANASAEIEYERAWAQQLGETGRGVRTILEMVHHTRLDTAMAPAGLMRRALTEAAWWCRGRRAFGRLLIDQPLMRAVLADLSLDWLGALEIGMRVARAFDAAASDPSEAAFARLAVALAKYWTNKRCPTVVAEAMECLGGSGYVEESGMPLVFRESPLNAIWEGSGNVICLDARRTIDRVPEALPALLAELDAARGAAAAYDSALDAVLGDLRGGLPEAEARRAVERLALMLQAALLIRADHPAAPGFVEARLGDAAGRTFGALPAGLDPDPILALLPQ